MALTDSWLKANNGKPRDRVEEFSDRGNGTGVRVSLKGKIVYQMRYRFAGKPYRLDVGTYPQMSLKEAREEFTKYLTKLDQGLNPKVEKRVFRDAMVNEITFEDLFNKWYASECDLTSKYHLSIHSSIYRYIIPVYRDIPVSKINLIMWLELLEDVRDDVPTISALLLSAIKRILKWGVKRGYTSLNVLSDITVKEDLGITFNRIKRHLSDDELILVFQGLYFSKLAYKNKLYIKLCLAYGCRNSEIRLALKSHFDFDKGIWTIPADNHKVGYKTQDKLVRPILPYTEKLIKELFRLNPKGELLITTDIDGAFIVNSAIDKSVESLVKWIKKQRGIQMDHWTPHDLRRTARTNFSPLTSYEVAETMIGHVLNNNSEVYDHYHYLPEQAKAYSLWFEKLESLERSAINTKWF